MDGMEKGNGEDGVLGEVVRWEDEFVVGGGLWREGVEEEERVVGGLLDK